MNRLLCIAAFSTLLIACDKQSQIVLQHIPPNATAAEVTAKVVESAKNSGDMVALPRSQILYGLPKDPPPGGGSGAATSGAAPSTRLLLEGLDRNIAAATPPNVNQVQVAVLPIQGERFVLTPVRDFWSSTQVSIKRIPNSDIVSSVGLEFKDLTKDRINLAGQVIGAALPLIAGVAVAAAPVAAPQIQATPGQPQPDPCASVTNLRPFALLVENDVPIRRALPNNETCFEYSLRIDGGNNGGVSIDSLKDSLAKSPTVPYFPVPACADATLTIYKKSNPPANQAAFNASLRVADPANFRLAPLPEKGAIALHQICGADVTDEGYDWVAKAGESLTALLDVAKKLRDASTGKGK